VSFRDSDTASNSSYESTSEGKALKHPPSVSSADTSRVEPFLSLSSEEEDTKDDLEEEEACEEFQREGVCWKGRDCTCSHGVKPIHQHAEYRGSALRMRFLQNFP
jgi:hypothetical protein